MKSSNTEKILLRIKKDPLAFLLTLLLPLDLLIGFICVPFYWDNLDVCDKILSVFVLTAILFICLYERIIQMLIADMVSSLKTFKR